MHTVCMVGQRTRKVPSIQQSLFVNDTEVQFEVDAPAVVSPCTIKNVCKAGGPSCHAQVRDMPNLTEDTLGRGSETKGWSVSL